MSTITPRRLIIDAYRSLGVLRPGQGPTEDGVEEALGILNDMVDAWQLERLMIYGISPTAYTVPPSPPYTLGAGGTLGATVPVRIEAAEVIRNGVKQDLPILALDCWRAGRSGIWIDSGYPVATLHATPALNAGETLTLYGWQPVTQFKSADQRYDFAPGYAKALRWNLACEMAPGALIQRKIPDALYQSIERYAIESKAWIKSFHSSPPPVMSGDPALACGCSGGAWDIYTG